MSVPMFPLLHADPALAAVKKKRVLLVDSSRTKRDLRSETMRKLGADVDCAADISEARCWWRADLYDLVLMHVEATAAQTDKFCDDMRRAMPHQQIMFLVGKPEYLAASPNNGQMPFLGEEELAAALYEQAKTPLMTGGLAYSSQRWGILEACRRISAVRSAMNARTRALRERPEPQRDSEVSRPRRATETVELGQFTEIMKEEAQ